MNAYKIFISHGSHDLWLAGQMAKEIREIGASIFLDEASIPKGADFKKRIHAEIKDSHELVVLFTPWSVKRSWIWIEIGAAWICKIPIVAVFYGMSINDLDMNGQGKAILEDINILELNDFEIYLGQLKSRIGEAMV